MRKPKGVFFAGALLGLVLGVATVARAGNCDADPIIAARKKALDMDPNNVRERHQLAGAYYMKQCFEEAFDQMRKVINTNKGDTAAHAAVDAEAYQVLGIISYQVLKEDGEAVKYFKISMEMSPKEFPTLWGLSLALSRMKKYEEAVPVMEKALEVQPKNLEAQFQLATALNIMLENKKEGDPVLEKKLIETYEKTVALATPKKNEEGVKDMLVVSLTRLGYLYRKLNDHKKAIDSFRRSLKYNPDDYNANYLLGLEYFANKEYDKMTEAYERATKAAPKEVDAHFNLGVAYINQQRYDEAAMEFRTITQLESGNSEALVLMASAIEKGVEVHLSKGTSLLTEEKLKDALEEFRKVLALDSGNISAKKYLKDAEVKADQSFKEYMDLANQAKKRNDKVEELSQLELALGLKPDNSDAKARWEDLRGEVTGLLKRYLERGQKAEKEKKFQDAADEYQKALKIKADDAPAQAALARVERAFSANVTEVLKAAAAALARGDLRAARNLYQKALQTDKENKQALNGLTKANTMISEAIKTKNGLGEKAYNAGNKTEAKQLFEAVLKLEPANATANDFIKRMTGSVSTAKLNAEEIKKLYYQGVDFYVNGQLDKAIQAWTEVLKLDPSHEDARKNRDRALAKQAAIKRLKG